MFFWVVGYTLVSSNINHCNKKWIITISIRIYHNLPISGLGPKFSRIVPFVLGRPRYWHSNSGAPDLGRFYQDFDLGLFMIYLSG